MSFSFTFSHTHYDHFKT